MWLCYWGRLRFRFSNIYLCLLDPDYSSVFILRPISPCNNWILAVRRYSNNSMWVPFGAFDYDHLTEEGWSCVSFNNTEHVVAIIMGVDILWHVWIRRQIIVKAKYEISSAVVRKPYKMLSRFARVVLSDKSSQLLYSLSEVSTGLSTKSCRSNGSRAVILDGTVQLEAS